MRRRREPAARPANWRWWDRQRDGLPGRDTERRETDTRGSRYRGICCGRGNKGRKEGRKRKKKTKGHSDAWQNGGHKLSELVGHP